MSIRRDKFNVGDTVYWDPDFANVTSRQQDFHPPFTITRIFERRPASWRSMGHTQHLVLNFSKSDDDYWSGAFFQKVQLA